jgi:restriction system protein
MARFEQLIRDPHTGEKALIRSNDEWTLESKIQRKIESWQRRHERQENRQRKEQEKLQKEKLHEEAEKRTEESRALIEAYRGILRAAVGRPCRLDWAALHDDRPYQPGLPPKREAFLATVPRWSVLDLLWPPKRRARLAAKKEAARNFEHAFAAFEKEEETRRAAWEAKRSEFNTRLDRLKQDYEAGRPAAIEQYMEKAFNRSRYPEDLDLDVEVNYLGDRKTLIVELELLRPDQVPTVIEVKRGQGRDEFIEKTLKNTEANALYNDVIAQIGIRTLYEAFNADYANTVEVVVLNGWVDGTDTKTGRPFRNCIVSIQAERSEFCSFNLERVLARDCIAGLKGVVASEFVNLAPVKPILQLNKQDRRIVEAKDVLGNLDSTTNLATMDWELFEHLVRDLFQKIFSGEGVEVKVTQASRDAGVDALVFDPDPIKGGKFVIQAKRYNNVVGVSAVRDLYGTMISEGAVKGILVTTSHFGKDSLEFVKNKPITLIGGAELIYLFNKHGHNFKIELKAKA